MSEQVEKLILEYLRAIRGDIATIKEDIRELKMRMTSLETHVAICSATSLDGTGGSAESTNASVASSTVSKYSPRNRFRTSRSIPPSS